MTDCFRDVLEFHRKYGAVIGTTPAVPDDATVMLRCRLIDEEAVELQQALGVDDLSAIAKESIDLVYVVVGMLIAYGIDPRPIWADVHRSNMTKGDGKRGDQKVEKGPNYQTPDIAEVLSSQGPLPGGQS